MTQLKTTLLDIYDLESLDLKTTNKDGKRYYTDTDESFYYPSVTSVTGLLSRDHIKLWRKRVGEETANKITAQATKRGTNFHNLVEDYLRKDKEYIEFDNGRRTYGAGNRRDYCISSSGRTQCLSDILCKSNGLRRRIE